MNNLIKFGLIGAAGYLLWQRFTPVLEPVATPAAPGLAPNTAATPTPAAVTQAQSSATRDLVLQAARRAMPAGWDSLLNSHEWNYYYTAVRGVPGPDPGVAFPGRENMRMSVDEWWSGASTRGGISGLSNYAVMRGGYVPAWTR